ncbi:hypothetical protein CY658_32135 [Variovorax sp. RO1]|uniref:hypothetical protein n=1 Tax=unclassified Variovorax TaxID=663243 RepID=UPI000C718292|nr:MULTISPECIES: hypothetical protein [unclassified Variovorax]PLC01433.1 hypothetical protein CY658_32135 [Variovorax sp. RO1]QOF78334.1 hypothetical protein IG196_29255 [Variovorax sp. 38R]
MTNSDQAPGPDADELRAQLRAKFFQWREVYPHAHIYALLDLNCPVAPYDELHPSHLSQRPMERHIEPVHRPDLAHEIELLPQLLQLYVAGEHGYADEALIDLMLDSAVARCRSVNGAYVAGWLCSDASPAAVARHLSKAGVVFDKSQARQRYLPFFEPYRLALLADDPAAAGFLRRWLGPVRHWVLVDTAGALKIVSASSPDDAESAVSLGLEQFASQARIATARFVVMALTRSGITIATQPELRIDAAIRSATHSGLSRTEDIVFYALNVFTLGSRWAEHPQAAQLIRQVAGAPDDQVGLAQLVAALPDVVLDEIAASAHE